VTKLPDEQIAAAKALAQTIVDNEGNIFLRELVRGLKDPKTYPARRTASELRDVIHAAIEDGEITYDGLRNWLTSVQGWGKEWVYLWSIPKNSARSPSWSPAKVRSSLPTEAMRSAFS